MRRFHSSGSSLERERLGEHLLLELEAQDDVQVVGRLVGVDADQRRPHGVHLAVPRLGVDAARARPGSAPAAAGRSSARTAASGRRGSPTCGSATRARRARRRAPSGVRSSDGSIWCSYSPWPNSCIVAKSAVEAVVEVARRQPDVLRPAAGRERVHGRVEPPGRRRRSRSGARPRARTVFWRLEVEASAPATRGSGSASATLLHELRLVLLHVGEQRPHLGARHAALVVVEQRVVRLREVAVEARDVAPAQRRGSAAASGRNDAKSSCSRAPHPRPQPERRRSAPSPRAGRTAPCTPSASRGARRGSGSPRTSRTAAPARTPASSSSRRPTSGDGELLVGDAAERRQLLRADGRAARRHHRLLVPTRGSRSRDRGR